MIVVAITQRLVENESYAERRECLDVRWGRLCSRLGLLPVALPTEFEPLAYFERFAPSGVILTGGNDLSSVSPSALSNVRDDHERRVLSLALARKIPVLGICRGMQLVAEHFGAPIVAVEGHTGGIEHGLSVVPTTRFGRGRSELHRARSYHDFGLRTAPDSFDVVARSPDGVVEAMEHRALPVYCQMWHPERENALSESEAGVLRSVFQDRA